MFALLRLLLPLVLLSLHLKLCAMQLSQLITMPFSQQWLFIMGKVEFAPKVDAARDSRWVRRAECVLKNECE